MHTLDLTKRALRNLNQAKLRTLLTAGAMGVGAFALTLTLALGTSLNNLSERLLFQATNRNFITVTARQPQFEATDPNAPQEYKEGGAGSSNPFSFRMITAADIAEIEKIDGVIEVRRDYAPGTNAQYIEGPTGKRYKISLLTAGFDGPISMRTGSYENLADGEIVIPEKHVPYLGFSSPEDALGKTVTLGYADATDIIVTKTFTIAGVAVKPSGLAGIFNPDAAHLNAADIRAIYDVANAGLPNADTFFMISAVADENASVEELASIRDSINAIGAGERLEAKTRADESADNARFVFQIQLALGGFAAIVLFASLFGIVNTQLMSVMQRTREIGLMKALGLSNNAVSLLFLFESMLIGLIGSIIGILVAYGVARAVDPFLVRTLEDLNVVDRFLIFNPWQLIVLAIALMVIGGLAGIGPSRRAAKLDPVEALRTE